MVKELGIEAIRIEQGVITASTRVKTENGTMGMSLSFELRKESQIGAAVKMLEDAIEEAMVNNLAMTVPMKAATDA